MCIRVQCVVVESRGKNAYIVKLNFAKLSKSFGAALANRDLKLASKEPRYTFSIFSRRQS